METLNNCKLMIPFFVLLIGFISGDLQSQILDNKTFTITMNDVNNPIENKQDILIFDKGKFDSKECQPYGFLPSDYTSSIEGNNIRFSAICHSEKEGIMLWKGTVKGSKIEGTAIWTKEDQDDITYNFSGKVKSKTIQ